MALYAPTVANIILQMGANRDRNLTPEEVHALVYLSHGWSLAIKEAPLVRNPFLTSNHGVITEELVMVFNGLEKKDIMRNINCNLERIDFGDLDTIEGCVNFYFQLDRQSIINRPTIAGTPWQLLHHDNISIAIPDSITKEYFINEIKPKNENLI